MRHFWIASVVLAGCHWLLPHRPIPVAADAQPVDRARGDLVPEPAPLEAGPDRTALDTLVVSGDRGILPDKKPLDTKIAKPDTKIAKPDTKIAKPDTTPDLTSVDDAGACSTWAGWAPCPSFASFYCKAWCGNMNIDCTATACTCFNGVSKKACGILPSGYCLGCQEAFESGCCE